MLARKQSPKDPVTFFREAEAFVRHRGFEEEIYWAEHRSYPGGIQPREFLQQFAWVVLTTGMKVQTIQQKWDALAKVFWWFELQELMPRKEEARTQALRIFNHVRKIDAILQMGELIWTQDFYSIRQQILEDAPDFHYLETLPFIGKVTKFHLARNIGFDVIKPDRHLVRLGKWFGLDPVDLCENIQKEVDLRLGTIDLILWRYCEQGQFPSNIAKLDDFTKVSL